MKQSSKAKRISFLIILSSLALIVALVFGLCSPSVTQTRGAAINADNAGSQGIRFTKVVSGEDFGLGLTYNGRVYIWSTAKTVNQQIKDGTLGEYYYSDDFQMFDVTPEFKKGPNLNGVFNDYNTTDYHSAAGAGTHAVNIAATRYTAAIVDSNGMIYTMGRDDFNTKYSDYYLTRSSDYHYLLMRNTSGNRIKDCYEPDIINYNITVNAPYYNNKDIAGINSVKIEGAEFNYIIAYQKSGGSGVNFYAWGSQAYNVPFAESGVHTSSTEFVNGQTAVKDEYKEVTISGISAINDISLVAGGHTVGYVHNNSLYIRGANVYSNAGTPTPVFTLESNGRLPFTPHGTNYLIAGESVKNSNHAFSKVSGMTFTSDASNNLLDASNGNNLTTNASAGIINVNITSERFSMGNRASLGVDNNTNIANNGRGNGNANLSVPMDNTNPILAVAAENGKTQFGDGNVAQMLQFTRTAADSDYVSGCALDGNAWSAVLTANTLYYARGADDGSLSVSHLNLISLTSGYDSTCMYALSRYGKIYRISNNDTVSVTVSIMENYGDSVPKYALDDTTYFDLGAIGKAERYSVSIQLNDRNSATAGNITPIDKDNPSSTPNDILKVNGANWQNGSKLPIVSSNYSGDMLRFATVGDALRTFVGNVGGGSLNFAPKFSVEETRTTGGNVTTNLTAAQAENMFSYSVSQEETAVSVSSPSTLTITPKRSTNGKSVICSFFVMRYDAGNTAYDFKEVKFKFSVANSAATTNAATGFYENGQSLIPPLDVNNDQTRSYSFAVQDVTTGFDRLAEYIKDVTGYQDSLYSNIITKVKEQDNGFPATEKISNGNLSYYLGNNRAAEYYNDTYKFLYSDIDADLIELAAIDGANINSFVDVTTKDVVLTFRATTDNVNSLEYTVVNWLHENDGATYQTLLAEFNNLYGLTITQPISDEINGTRFEIRYKVVTFTAKKAISDIMYKTQDNTQNVLSQINLSESATGVEKLNISAFYAVTEKNSYNFYNNTYGTSSSNVVASPTVNLTVDANLIVKDDNNAIYYGNNSTINLTRSLALGETLALKLSDFLSDTTSITYTLDGSCSETEFSKISGRFPDSTSSGATIVQLTRDTLTVFPTDTNTLYIEVGLQRFAGTIRDGNEFRDAVGSSSNIIERISLVLTVSVSTNNVTALLSKNENAPSLIAINNDSILDLISTSGVNLTSFYNVNQGYIKDLRIRNFVSSDTSVLDVEADPDSNTKLKLIPRATGSAMVTFVMQLYSYVIPASVVIDVTKTTYLNDSYDVVSVNYVGVSTLMSKLNIRAENFKLPLTEAGGAISVADSIFFTDESGTLIEDNHGWPDFISEVTIVENGARIRLAPNLQSTSTSGKFFMHIRFIPTAYDTYDEVVDKSSVLEAVVTVSCSRSFATSDDGQGIYIVSIDNDNVLTDTAGDWYYNKELNRVVLPLATLLKKVDSSLNEDSYSIVNIQAQDSAGYEYIDNEISPDKKYVYINPLYNTVNTTTDNCYLFNVSVSSTSAELMIVSFYIRVEGITTVLTTDEYRLIVSVSFVISAVIVLLYFIVATIIYLNRRSKQREIIRKNRELIKMRDQVHSKGTGNASSQDIVAAKLKLQDPKYQKMLSKIKKKKSYDDNTILADDVSSTNANTNDFTQAQVVTDSRIEKKKGKKQKKSVEELKAEMKQRQNSMNSNQDTAPTFNDMFKNIENDSDGVVDVEVVDFDNK